AVAAVGILAVLAAGHPSLDVHHGGVLNADVAGAALDHPVREVEALQHLLAIPEHFLVPALALLDVVAADDHLLALVELVDAVEPRRVLAVGAGLPAEASADRH